MKLLKVDTLKQAEDKLMQCWKQIEWKTEMVDLKQAENRTLAEDVRAQESVPDFNKSTVDGYAVKAKNTHGAGDSIPCFLEIIGDVSIGVKPEKTVGEGQCMYVPTGGMLPDGADAVVMVEHTELFSEAQAAIYDAVSPGRNVIRIGEDTTEGDAVLQKGMKLTPARIGVLASLGFREISVYMPPKVSIISTGNELVTPGQERKPGQVNDVNTYGLAGLCSRNGLQVIHTQILRDNEEALCEAIKEASADSDIVAVSGGSSQGKQDYTEKVFEECAPDSVFTHGLTLKPGKPTILGFDWAQHTLFAGLPGHPMAALVVFDLLILKSLRRHMRTAEAPKLRAKMEINAAGGAGRTVCLPVQLKELGGAEYTARPLFGKSGLISVLAKADGYVLIDAEKEGLKEGEMVEVTPF